MKFFSVVLALFMLLASMHADAAKRFGGGKSFGQQSGNVTQRDAGRSAPNAAPNAAPSPVPAAPPAAAPRRPWGAMLGGLAAGLGLAWLAHSMGFGAEFGQLLMFGLIAMAVVALIGFFMRRRGPQMPADPYAYGGAGSSTNPGNAPQYNPAKIGNDASARPWEQNNAAFDSAAPARSGVRIGSSLMGGSQNWFIPADFDTNRFLQEAKAQFVEIQKVWDSGDLSQMRNFLTDDLLKEWQVQLAGRIGKNHTEVVLLNAEILGIEKVTDGHLASVRFSGMLREQVGAEAFRFEEVWNLFKPEQGGWLLAGIQLIPVTQAS